MGSGCGNYDLLMISILRRLPVKMVYETGKSIIASTQLTALNVRANSNLAAKLNGVEHRTYEVFFKK